MLEDTVFLMKLYLRFTQKILKETKDPEIKVLILLNYRDKDLKKLLIEMYKLSKKVYQSLKNKDIERAYYYKTLLEKKYLEFKIKTKERIKNMVKIRAFDLSKNS